MTRPRIRYERIIRALRINDIGMERAKIHVLEALLRLRQAACHPGLIDQGRRGDTSSKLEALLELISADRFEGQEP